MTGFSRADAEQRLGPAVVELVRRRVDTAPPLSVEQREQLRAVFVSARPRRFVSRPTSQDAA